MGRHDFSEHIYGWVCLDVTVLTGVPFQKTVMGGCELVRLFKAHLCVDVLFQKTFMKVCNCLEHFCGWV